MAPGTGPEKKSKKRKSAAAAEEDEEEDADSSSKGKNKAKPSLYKQASTVGLGGTQKELPRDREEFEETQVVEESQETQRRGSVSEVIREEEEEEMAETQVDETQEAQVSRPSFSRSQRAVLTITPLLAGSGEGERRSSACIYLCVQVGKIQDGPCRPFTSADSRLGTRRRSDPCACGCITGASGGDRGECLVAAGRV